MYSAQRTELERSGKRMKAKRGNLHFTEAGELCLKPGSARPLSAEEVGQYIVKYRREFPRAVIDLEGYTAIDQGGEGACSFVGFLNLACLTGNVAKLRKNTVATWKRIWASFRIAASEDIASTLDKVVAQKIVSPDAIVYIPIRSSGAGENMYNVTFWRPGLTMQRFGLQLSAYNEAPFVYEVGNLIESAIDAGVPIEVNALCHSRVCVAYNDTNLLFADNWTHAHTQTMSGMGNLVDFDVYAAGFSVVSKWAVYSAARDVVSFRVD